MRNLINEISHYYKIVCTRTSEQKEKLQVWFDKNLNPNKVDDTVYTVIGEKRSTANKI